MKNNQTVVSQLLSLIPSGSEIKTFIFENNADEKMLDEWLWERIYKDKDWLKIESEQINKSLESNNSFIFYDPDIDKLNNNTISKLSFGILYSNLQNIKLTNTLIFNGKVYELIEVPHDRFVVYDAENGYKDIGDADVQGDDPFRCYCRCLKIKGKFYALKLLKNSNNEKISEY